MIVIGTLSLGKVLNAGLDQTFNAFDPLINGPMLYVIMRRTPVISMKP